MHLEDLFNDVSLCGPKSFTSPENREKNMCELFYPYGHLLGTFHAAFEQMFSSKGVTNRLRAQGAVSTSFIELMAHRQNNRHSKQTPSETALKAAIISSFVA